MISESLKRTLPASPVTLSFNKEEFMKVCDVTMFAKVSEAFGCWFGVRRGAPFLRSSSTARSNEYSQHGGDVLFWLY